MPILDEKKEIKDHQDSKVSDLHHQFNFQTRLSIKAPLNCHLELKYLEIGR